MPCDLGEHTRTVRRTTTHPIRTVILYHPRKAAHALLGHLESMSWPMFEKYALACMLIVMEGGGMLWRLLYFGAVQATVAN